MYSLKIRTLFQYYYYYYYYYLDEKFATIIESLN